MATLARVDSTAATTTDSTAYASASFTPTAGDLLVVYCRTSGTVLAAPTLTGSANGLTFTRVGRILTNAGVNMMIAFVANQLVPASPVAMTVNLDLTGDNGSGLILGVMGVGGVTKTGTAAVRQAVGTDNNHAALGTPTLTLTLTAVAGNPLLGFTGNVTNSTTTTTPPAGWTEYLDQGYATPTIGGSISGLAAGAAVSSVTWGGSMTAGGVMVLEIDATATAAAAPPPLPQMYQWLPHLAS